MEELERLLNALKEKIVYGEDLIEQLEFLEDIDGVKKLQRKIRQEVDFLKRIQKRKRVMPEQLSCSNLRHLGAMVECAKRPGVIAVSKVFHLDNTTKLLIDIVSDQGKTWTKVIARNPRSLSALSSGNASYGARSTLDQAEDYMECAKLYPCMYQTPKVVFELMSGVEEHLANKLKSIGIIVKGDILPNSTREETYDESSCESELSDEDDYNCPKSVSNIPSADVDPEINTLNLDVTTMMAYVSNMTNGHCDYVFKQKVLTEQCEWEAARPVKPLLERLFKDKTLVCCKTAWDNFEKIVHTLGGQNEIKRTEALKQMVTIYPDDHAGEDDDMRKTLSVRGHVRQRSKVIFNFGHRIKALTVSANEGFVRAAYQQGVTYASFIHESRALTEGKEPTAKKILL